MAIGNVENAFELDVVSTADLDWQSCRILEMGSIKRKSDLIDGDPNQTQHLDKMRSLKLYPRCGAKYYYLQILGAEKHASIDLNGAWESLKLDLDRSLPSDFHNDFNLITNYGTGEHVNNQYSFFKNVHDSCMIDGVMIHMLNGPNYVLGHGRYEYQEKFAEELAELCGYEIILRRPFGYYRAKYKQASDDWYDKVHFVAYRKVREEPFPSHAKFDKLSIIDTGFTARTGNYNTAEAKSRVTKLKKLERERYFARKAKT